MAKRLASGGAFNSSTGANSGQSGLSNYPQVKSLQKPLFGLGNSGSSAYGGLETVQNGTQQISQSLDNIKNALGGQGGGSFPQPIDNTPRPDKPIDNTPRPDNYPPQDNGLLPQDTVQMFKKGGKVKKHFYDGGFNQSGAYGGLQSINQGEGQVSQSLDTISGALGDNNKPIPTEMTYQQIPAPTVLGATNNSAMKKGGNVKAFKKGGSVRSSSSRGDGIAQRGFTRGKYC
jgi:hypothetical protein